MKVFIYRNLHKKCWSAKALEGSNKGRVVWRGPLVALRNAKPKVSEAGRQRVLKERRKNVHAGIVGDMVNIKHAIVLRLDEYSEITYSPYVRDSFFFKDSGDSWSGSELVLFSDNQVFARIGAANDL